MIVKGRHVAFTEYSVVTLTYCGETILTTACPAAELSALPARSGATWTVEGTCIGAGAMWHR